MDWYGYVNFAVRGSAFNVLENLLIFQLLHFYFFSVSFWVANIGHITIPKRHNIIILLLTFLYSQKNSLLSLQFGEKNCKLKKLSLDQKIGMHYEICSLFCLQLLLIQELTAGNTASLAHFCFNKYLNLFHSIKFIDV